MRDLLAQGQREDMAFVFLIIGCFMVFVAQLPRLSREAYETGQDFMLLMGGTLMAWIFVAPLLFYGLAAISHLVARAVGGGGTWFGARLALFWSLLAVSPAMLLHGLTAGFIGPGPALSLVGLIVLMAFLWIWIGGLTVVERAP
ncbi:YIP1 family protein [Jannaschia sp. 2305UL9-9]|uniref:YIP1 family protein n=1 Tax=Jannaschia sp. 2305UL9-9 TaxID=3121638 RepID=UPI003526F246